MRVFAISVRQEKVIVLKEPEYTQGIVQQFITVSRTGSHINQYTDGIFLI